MESKTARKTRLTPEREAELYEAVLAELCEIGYEQLTMDAVAARCRCSKATLYRQWSGKPQLVAQAVRHSKRGELLSYKDTGSLRGDLHVIASRFAKAKAKKDLAVVRAISPAMRDCADLRDAMRETIFEPELGVIRSVVDHAVARGELTEGAKANDYLPHLLFGAVFTRPFIEGREPDTAYLRRYVDDVVLPALTRN
ncbi:TetR/AcrR family transcriptional regulator [Sciscionella marina]|uniref:TetR/AcrR family transcriptional regulator n=1 Tax=Sciscionella marina TaxID=508770 RepID=UPI0003685098|nr:TetR/AcrR family transcriptional regulator [Sciscionella marina]